MKQEKYLTCADRITNATVELEAAQNILSLFIGRYFTEYDGDPKTTADEILLHWNSCNNILLHISGILINQIKEIDAALDDLEEARQEEKLKLAE